LVNSVLTSRPQRHPLENVILPKLKATNKTVEQYRSKVSEYLNSSEFNKRWDALKAQVGDSALRMLLTWLFGVRGLGAVT
jgi:hypothetical protein